LGEYFQTLLKPCISQMPIRDRLSLQIAHSITPNVFTTGFLNGYRLLPSGPRNDTLPNMSDVIYTVRQFNQEVRRLLESNYQKVWIEGEISNLAAPSSGHFYFTLKDNEAQIRCALFRNRRLGLRCTIEDGLTVHLMGRVSLYEVRGEFQIIVDYIEPAGEGILRRKFEELKQKLNREGLFELSVKKPLRRIPYRIGVITSPTGAAIRDILSTLNRRYPVANVLVYPVAVQGSQAAAQIVKALTQANHLPICDVLILSRGGGSLEDLWAFNEEVVVRAIHESQIPVVAGIGHEVDVTLSDLAADYRAGTPTGAAESVSPDQGELISELMTHSRQLQMMINHSLQQQAQHLDLLGSRLRHPTDRLHAHRQDLANMSARAFFASQANQHRYEIASLKLRQRLNSTSPILLTKKYHFYVENLNQSLGRLCRNLAADPARELSSLTTRLHALSTTHTLQRGYTILRDAVNGRVISDAAKVRRGQVLEAELTHGSLQCTVDQVSTPAQRPDDAVKATTHSRRN
jgi:exodeoxyribonuclease VII large subunit